MEGLRGQPVQAVAVSCQAAAASLAQRSLPIRCAAVDGLVGLDVENQERRIRSDPMRLAQRRFSHHEIADLQGEWADRPAGWLSGCLSAGWLGEDAAGPVRTGEVVLVLFTHGGTSPSRPKPLFEATPTPTLHPLQPARMRLHAPPTSCSCGR